MNKKVTDDERDIIHAAKYMPTADDIVAIRARNSKERSYKILYSAAHEELLLKLFGDVPDYSDPQFEDLWDEVLGNDPEDVFDFCLRKGIDVFDADGKPVPPWRDIAVILLALDKGILDVIS